MNRKIGTRIRMAAPAALLAAALAVSCGGGGGSSGGMIPPPSIQPTLASIQANVFTPSCALSGCHAGASPQQGMNLSTGLAFASIVDVASAEQPARKRVDPADATGSYLFMKITGDPAITGARMPFGRPALSAEAITAIRDWIDAGAPK